MGDKMNDSETFLGDDLYCSFDGEQFRLRSPRAIWPDNVVYLDHERIKALIDFCEESMLKSVGE